MGLQNNLIDSVTAMLDNAGISFFEKDEYGESIKIPISAQMMGTSNPAEKVSIIERAIDLLEADAYLKEATGSKLRDISKVDVTGAKKFFKQMKMQFRRLLASSDANLTPDAEFEKIMELEKMLQFKVKVNEK